MKKIQGALTDVATESNVRKYTGIRMNNTRNKTFILSSNSKFLFSN